MVMDKADPAKEALNQAVALAAAGKYAEALEKHVWYHEHALDSGYGQYGVRLSFALKYWVELGAKYPPALEKLKAIRGENMASILGGELSRELFHDIHAIDHSLGESEATVQFFKEIAVKQPEFAGTVYDLADEALIAHEEYELAARYLGDPLERLETAQRGFEHGMTYARGQSDPERAEKARETFEGIFERDILRIMTVLEKTGDVDRAREVQKKALGIFDSSKIRTAL
jgi:tetratricopeptide (TPR) repeat protein